MLRIVLLLFVCTDLMAQTRADDIKAERANKAANLQPDDPSTLEKYFTRIEDALRRGPFHIGAGGVQPGAGLTLGVLFERNNKGDHIRSKLWASGSIYRFYSVGTGVEFPHISGSNFSFALEGSHSDAPRIEYFGEGPNSSEDNRTDYRLEETLFESRLRYNPNRWLESDCHVGELLLNVGPGTHHELPSTESFFTPAQAPGVNVQSNYLIGGCSVQADDRDFPGDPHKGTYAAAGYDRYYAQDPNRFSFHRFSSEIEHYIPFFNQKRVIALRGITELRWHAHDQVVPFYMQSILGSDSTLRGFRRWRFYDENSLLLNGEYRWPISMGWDMALFVDAGKVFNKPGQLNFAHMETTGGFGFRLKGQRGLSVRLDTGFSREGARVWLRFGKLF